VNKQDSYEELLELEKKRKKRTESFRKFLSTEANTDNETIKKIITDLVFQREILPLEKMTNPSDTTNKYDSLDIFISSRLKVTPQTYLHTLDTEIISIYGKMMLIESLENMDVLDRMMELCMDARKQEISRLETEAEFKEKLLSSGTRYAKFLCKYKDMEKEAALSYVNHLIEIEKSSEEFKSVNENNNSSKADYPYPPSKGKNVRPAVKESTSDEDDILHLCELSSAVNRSRIEHEGQKQERAETPPVGRTFSMEDMKGLDENINRRINSLFCKILSSKTSHEIDVLNGVIDSIFNKKSGAINALSMMSDTMRGKDI